MVNTDNMVSFIAGGTITGYSLVAVDAAGKVQMTSSSSSEAAVGIAQRAVSAGDAVDVPCEWHHSRDRRRCNRTRGNFSFDGFCIQATLRRLVKGSGNVSVARVIPNINHASPASGDQITVVFTGPSNYHT